MVDVIIGSILTTTTNWTGFCCPPFLFIPQPAQLICSLLLTSSSRRPPYEVSEKIASAVDESLSKQPKFFLCQQSAAFQRKLSALLRGFSNSLASSPTNDGAKSVDDDELDDPGYAIWHRGEEDWH